MSGKDDIKAILDSLYADRSPRHVINDPLSFCHRYPDPVDREIAAVIASSFAYGSVRIILRSLETIFSRLGSSPRKFVDSFDPRKGLESFARFRHRFNDGRDLCALLWGMRQMVEQSGSLQAFFLNGYSAADKDLGSSLNNFSAATLSLDYSHVFGVAVIPESSYFPFLFPAPASGSACKRLCMLLRWLVRPADGIDLGVWELVSPAQLIIPVDTHISRLGRYLGLTARKGADWRTALEITAALRVFDHNDPVKYDFPLVHLGISGGCNGKDLSHCPTCHVAEICTQNAVTGRNITT